MRLPLTLDVARNSNLLRIAEHVPTPDDFLDILNMLQKRSGTILAAAEVAPSFLRHVPGSEDFD
jgi:hypothetical protein